eukprot:CAMPEP_0175085340 /NCGR_PEP_ID=MMETSP0052_2-20121109/28605_1 /TAXON_ID=51329 ORGANISM="Polytomella parva, Strain SAG 63-3" /NCGR_SAMPLE_ID=MMETSP0052_2 /ASSEMBLY_ACC=CAM_ASM_000194 /LENGTH=39 /DNA_ID= /DNA_START= /DNA_END= /DNA_ORIENTATION=
MTYTNGVRRNAFHYDPDPTMMPLGPHLIPTSFICAQLEA